MIKRCDICNIEFEAIKPTKKYCSPECAKQGAKIRGAKRRGNDIIKDCPICGERFETKKNGALTKYCSQDCADEARRIRQRDRWRAANPGWDEGMDKVCEYCGERFTDKAKSKHARFCSDECGQTWYSREIRGHGSLEDRRTIWEKQKAETRKRKAKERAERERAKRAEEKQKREQAKLIRDALFKKGTCVVCGESFMTIHSSQITCSDKCSRRWVRRKKDKRINSDNCVDHDITLSALFDRDNGRCHICGDECDWEDYKENDGNVCVGITYPSIDHVQPLSKGGMHSWANVKLAHHYCNTIKNDEMPTRQSHGHSGAGNKKSDTRKAKGKQVKQFTTDGELVAVYESTTEAERKTGFKQRGIQGAARGEQHTSHGYVWSY